ncbi:MAG: TetR/AcrR family transcriptional regulator [Janthinobacterium lividum]
MSGRGRPREFDRQEALRSAMLVFWDRGYDGSSLHTLISAMHIRSPSLYAAFGSKEALFLEALELYWDTIGETIWSELYRHSTAREGIERMLWATARLLTEPGRPHGCFVCHTEPRLDSPVLSREVKALRRKPVEMLRNRLLMAQTTRELTSELDCNAMSDYFAAVQRGMTLIARDGVSREQLERVAALAMVNWLPMTKAH